MTTGTTAQVQYCATFSASCQSYYFRNFRGGSFKALLRNHEGIGRRPEVFIFKPRNRLHQESVSESRNRGEQKHQMVKPSRNGARWHASPPKSSPRSQRAFTAG